MKTKLGDGRRWLIVALALPIAGVAGLIVRSEVALRGHEWRFPIRGHDPRDLLRGHYLTYRIDWGAEQVAGCTRCCICLERHGAAKQVSRVECDSATRCDARVSSDAEGALSLFYVPENEAQRLERAVRLGQGEIVLVERRGRLSIKELLIDGQQWRNHAPAQPGQ